jgi:hypothetical protein
MRSKSAWCWLAALVAIFYGAIGLLASVDKALTQMFSVHDCDLIMRAASGWVMVASVGILALLGVITLVTFVVAGDGAVRTCIDLMRLQRSAFLGALFPFACTSDDAHAWAPLAALAVILVLVVDRRVFAKDRPWQTWPLLALTCLVSGILFLSCL